MQNNTSQLETTGKVTELKQRFLDPRMGMPTPSRMTLYMPMIPLLYLKHVSIGLGPMSGPNRIEDNILVELLRSKEDSHAHLLTDEELHKAVLRRREKLDNNALLSELLYRVRSRPDLYAYIQNAMEFDNAINFLANSTPERISSNNTKDMDQAFDQDTTLQYTLRSYAGQIGYYSLYKGNSQLGTWHILAVCLPENVYYQRLHLLAKGSFDLSKIIILIDEALEDPGFPDKGLRTFYLGRIKEKIRLTSAQAWYVPAAFIQDQCKSNTVKLPYKKIADIKKGTESMATMFKNYARNSFMNIKELWVPPEEPTGPLVPSVEPTPAVDDRMKELNAGQFQGRSARAISAINMVVEHSVTQIREAVGLSPERNSSVSTIADNPGDEY